jgi:hypothetical protein
VNPPKKNRTNAQSLRTRRQSVSTRQSLAIRRELARNSENEWPIPPSLSYLTLLVWYPDPNTVTTTSLGLVKSPSVLPIRVACQKPSGRESILASKSRESHDLSGAGNLRGRSGDFCPLSVCGRSTCLKFEVCGILRDKNWTGNDSFSRQSFRS